MFHGLLALASWGGGGGGKSAVVTAVLNIFDR